MLEREARARADLQLEIRRQRDGEQALARANAKFERRFRAVEARLAAAGTTPEAAGLAEMEALWQAVKREG